MSDNVIVRVASNDDLPVVWELLLQSYLALCEFCHPSVHAALEQGGRDVRLFDLKDLQASYLSSRDSCFWVAEHAEHGVVGCAALRRANAEEAELKRMAVRADMRGQRIGERLVQAAETFAHTHGYLRIFLHTVNPRAAAFYRRVGFASFVENKASVRFTDNLVHYGMVKFLADKLIRRVAIVGGTHGNERIGVVLAQQWEREPQAVQRPSFSTHVLLANAEAARRNVRYVEVDLNRCFTASALAQPGAAHEQQLAAQIAGQLGPKREDGKEAACDFVLDLHSTTANMGLSIVMTADGDPFSRRLAHALAQAFPELKFTGAPGGKQQCWSIDSVAPSGFAIEVGPLAHGTLTFALLDATRRLVLATLDAIEAHNQRLLALVREQGAPQHELDGVALVVSPLVATPLPAPLLPLYERVATVDFPRDADGRLAGVVAPGLEGRDWSAVASTGEGLFVDLHGRPLTVPLALPQPFPLPPFVAPSPPPQLHAIFINEASYLEKGTAMVLCQQADKYVY